VTVANARQVKAIPGRKTDELDSQWLARVFSAGLVKPSYIPEKKIMELRSYKRESHFWKRKQPSKTGYTKYNMQHKAGVRAIQHFKDGQMLLNALMKGESIDEIIKYGSKRLKEEREEVKESTLGLGEAEIVELKICLENINRLEEQIRQLNAKIATLAEKNDVERISKVPGLEVSAKIADPRRFQNEKLYSWSGLAPSTYQTGGKKQSPGT